MFDKEGFQKYVGMQFLSIPVPAATQTVSHPRYILRFHRQTSHNVNYEFYF